MPISKEYSLNYYYNNKERYVRCCDECGYVGIHLARHLRSMKHLKNTGQLPTTVPKKVMNAIKIVEDYQRSIAVTN